MGKLKAVEEIVQKLAKKSAMGAEDAEKVLQAVRSKGVEHATSISGAEKQKYLDALDAVHGPRDVRAKDLGFGDKTYYHGTNKSFDEFSQKNAGASGRSHDESYFFTDKPEVANQFANHAADNEYLMNRNGKMSSLDLEKDERLRKQYEAALFSGDTKAAEKLDNQRLDMRYTDQNVIPVKLKTESPHKTEASGKYYDQRVMNNVFKNAKHEKADSIIVKNLLDNPSENGDMVSDVAVAFQPNQIRSTNAAFDPRFKDSPNILALNGGSAGATRAPNLLDKAGQAGVKTYLSNIDAESAEPSAASKIAQFIIGGGTAVNNSMKNAYGVDIGAGVGHTLHALDTVLQRPIRAAADLATGGSKGWDSETMGDAVHNVFNMLPKHYRDSDAADNIGTALDFLTPDVLGPLGKLGKGAHAAAVAGKLGSKLEKGVEAAKIVSKISNTAQEAARAEQVTATLAHAQGALNGTNKLAEMENAAKTADSMDLMLNSNLKGKAFEPKGSAMPGHNAYLKRIGAL